MSVDATSISLDIPLLTNGATGSELVTFGVESAEAVTHFAGPAAGRWLGDEIAAAPGAFFLKDASRTFGTWRVEVGQLTHSGNDILVSLVHL